MSDFSVKELLEKAELSIRPPTVFSYDTHGYISEALDKFIESEKQNKWISVHDRLPKTYELCKWPYIEYEIWDIYGKLSVSDWNGALGGSWGTAKEVLFWRHRNIPEGKDINGLWQTIKKEE